MMVSPGCNNPRTRPGWLGAGVGAGRWRIGAEELLDAVNGQLLDHVDVLATTVVALAWVAFGVLVGDWVTLASITAGGVVFRRSARCGLAGAGFLAGRQQNFLGSVGQVRSAAVKHGVIRWRYVRQRAARRASCPGLPANGKAAGAPARSPVVVHLRPHKPGSGQGHDRQSRGTSVLQGRLSEFARPHRALLAAEDSVPPACWGC